MMTKIFSLPIRLRYLIEGYTKTDISYLAHGGFWLFLGQVAATSSSFILAIAFANLLPAEVYGTYRYVLSFAGILAIPTLTGITGALTQAIARGLEGSYIPGLMLRLRWGVLGSLGSVGLALYYFTQGNNELGFAFALAAPFVPLIEIGSMYGAFLSGRKMFRESTLYFLLIRTAYVASLLIAIASTDNLYITLAAYFIPMTLVQFFLMYRLFTKYPPNDRSEPGTIRSGVHLSFNGIINQVGLYFDTVLLFHYLGPVGVAVYTFAAAPVRQIRDAYKNLPLLALPKLSVRSAQSINALMIERLIKLFGLGILIAVIYIITAPFIFSLLFPDYLESVFYSRILAIMLAFELPLVFLGAAVQSRLNVTPGAWLYMRNIPSILFIGSVLVLTPLYGILGVIVSRFLTSIAGFTINGLQWILFVKREKESGSS